MSDFKIQTGETIEIQNSSCTCHVKLTVVNGIVSGKATFYKSEINIFTIGNLEEMHSALDAALTELAILKERKVGG